MFRNHLVVTAATSVVAINYADIQLSLPLILVCVFFGSLLPDLDHPGSTIGKRLLFISVPLSTIFGHRQITHSILPFIAIYLIYITNDGLNYWIVGCVTIGYSSHLLADFFTDSGIPFFWPSQYRIKSPLPVKTGGVLKYLIAYSLLVSSFISPCKRLKPPSLDG